MHFESVPEQERSSRGFLVSGYTEEDYRRFLALSDYFYVYSGAAGVTGFLMAFLDKRLPLMDAVTTEIRRLAPNRLILIKQICVDPRDAGQGINTKLY